MPTFEIEQYELIAMKYRVEAASEAEAVHKVFAGDAGTGEPCNGFSEVPEDIGLPVDEYRELAAALCKLGDMRGKDEIIPSIRSVEQV